MRVGKFPRDLRIVLTEGAIAILADGQLLERFSSRRDEAAFEVLVARHGPMVLRVCRANLANPHDVEDAFQAVFLVLARRSSSVRSRDSVASWLYGVASRISARARVDAARRRKHERIAAESRSAVEPPAVDVPSVPLIEELNKLPHRYREAIVLCYLEGQSCDAAASQLGRPVNTVKSHLARGRELLKGRLIRRGIAAPLGLAAAGVCSEAVASIPPALTRLTVVAASRYAGGLAMASSSSLSLAQGVVRTMQLSRIGTIALFTVSLAAGALALGRGKPAEQQPSTPTPVVKADEPADLPITSDIPGDLTADPYSMTFALMRLARAQNNAGDRGSALATFRLADQVAGKVTNEHLRRLAIMRTAVARARIGDVGPAKATLERFAREARTLNGEARFNLMSMVIDFEFDSGFKESARSNLDAELAVVVATNNEPLKDAGSYRLLNNQVHLGDFAGALHAAEVYAGPTSNLRSSLIQTLLNHKMYQDSAPTLNDGRRALELAKEITYPYPRGMAEAAVAGALARAGDVDGGLILARNIGSGEDSSFDIRGSEASSALISIAEAQAQAGKISDAKSTIREAITVINNMKQKDVIHAERLRRVVEVQTKIGDIRGAQATAGLLEDDPDERARILVEVARAQHKASNDQAAASSLAEALLAAKGIVRQPDVINDDPGSRSNEVTQKIALAQEEIGDLKGALATVEAHGDDSWKSDCLNEIAKARANRGDIAGALATARLIPKASSIYSSIASAQARTGDSASARVWAAKLDEAAKAFAFVGIREGEAIRKAQAQ